MVVRVLGLLLAYVVIASTSTKDKRESACYGDLGCFQTTANFKNLPQDPKVVQTSYLLYTRQNRNTASVVKAADPHSTWTKELGSSHFSSSRPTKFIVHGFMDHGNKGWIIEMKDSLLNQGDYNIFLIDWGHGSQFPYEQATANTFLVGEQTALFIKNLHTAKRVNYNDIHFIGHSLGAQLSGIVGNKVNKIGRISGLDPAQPLFDKFSSNHYLDKSDATFVDVIHTDGADFSGIAGYGWIKASGHIDFYPNGGTDQPGCSDNPIGSAIDILLHGTDVSQVTHAVSCSHGRAHELYQESIASSCKFEGQKCHSWSDYESGKCHGCKGGCSNMGFHADLQHGGGSLYLSTAQNTPYCGSEFYVELQVGSHIADTYGRFYITITGSHGSTSELEFSRDYRHYLKTQTEKHVIAVHGSIGSVSKVTLRYKRGSGLAALGTPTDIKVKNISIRSLSTSHLLRFCEQSETTLKDGDRHSFSHTC
ncbi:hypothetical protein SNE40_021368 [Patella caerulea]|uniref:PLAT domain-containing protein n=1 Tax=Patella caerulea TaxID=87958 RepID=A0AAN8G3T5_PATCE